MWKGLYNHGEKSSPSRQSPSDFLSAVREQTQQLEEELTNQQEVPPGGTAHHHPGSGQGIQTQAQTSVSRDIIFSQGENLKSLVYRVNTDMKVPQWALKDSGSASFDGRMLRPLKAPWSLFSRQHPHFVVTFVQ